MMNIAIGNTELTAAELELELELERQKLFPDPQAPGERLRGRYIEINFSDLHHSKSKSSSDITEEHRLEHVDTDDTNSNKKISGLMAMPADTLSMEEFLQSIERRAFHMARMATGSRDDALDIVQDAMFKLVEKYSAKSASEWRPLFYRILNRKITDYYRRNAVKNRLFSLASFGMQTSDEGADVIDRAEARKSDAPDQTVARELQMQILTKAVAQLPGRQRQAFMLRCWDGMSTASTAETMGCSQGSVKTHYSRAMHSLRASLEDYRYEE
ncbi:RNA polymerase sigma factor [Porticoccaceae bacterium]|nr:RNA polymerase sigma factor [Porticoccaceae bacterium]